ncbi:hypothetical protein [Paenibacillus methanolicus]|uniref:hypothetical protein n=1 Tax=Paenibacillus methanolicus TaxID=582686 RepID=UPI0011E74249|nr:hypothetical protein [Paenibacillus methanolicus]
MNEGAASRTGATYGFPRAPRKASVSRVSLGQSPTQGSGIKQLDIFVDNAEIAFYILFISQ